MFDNRPVAPDILERELPAGVFGAVLSPDQRQHLARSHMRAFFPGGAAEWYPRTGRRGGAPNTVGEYLVHIDNMVRVRGLSEDKAVEIMSSGVDLAYWRLLILTANKLHGDGVDIQSLYPKNRV